MTWIGKLPSAVIVTTGKDTGRVTTTAGRPGKQQVLYITHGKLEAEGPSLTKGTEYYGLNEVFSNISTD